MVCRAGEVFSGAWKSIPWAAANSSMPTTPAELAVMSPRRRAAKVAMLTWSSWLAEVGRLSTLAGWAKVLFSEARAAAVTWAIIKPEFKPLSFTKNAGNSLIFGSTKMAKRRSETAAISAMVMARLSAASATDSA